MRPNYPLDCWYVAATSDEVGRELLARRLLDRPVVLYRQESGEVVALENRCAHRSYPLSKGRLEGDRLVCGYHGFTYDPSGQCVRVPSQASVPYGTCVRAYPVSEKPPFVWIWPGEPRRATLSAPPRLHWLTDEDWAASGRNRHVAANYMLIHEHYLDLTHIVEMHPEETPPGLEPGPLDEVEVSETSVTFTRKLPPAPLADWEAEATGLSRDRDYERLHHGTFMSPAVFVEGWKIFADDGKVYEQARIQAVTPESLTSTHMFWHFARNYALDRGEVGEHLHSVFDQVMLQDVAVIEEIQGHAGHLTAGRGVDISADTAALKARYIVGSMLAREAGATGGRHRFVAARRQI